MDGEPLEDIRRFLIEMFFIFRTIISEGVAILAEGDTFFIVLGLTRYCFLFAVRYTVIEEIADRMVGSLFFIAFAILLLIFRLFRNKKPKKVAQKLHTLTVRAKRVRAYE